MTAEVTPHHLTFTDADLLTYDSNLKMNPPLRGPADRDALRAGLVDGTIDAIATDHAPHAVEEKEAEFDLRRPARSGSRPRSRWCSPSSSQPGLLSLSRALETLSCAPARILGATEHGGPVQVGRPANLVLFDPNESGSWRRRSPRRRATARSWGGGSRAGFAPPCLRGAADGPRREGDAGERSHRRHSSPSRTARSSAGRRSAPRVRPSAKPCSTRGWPATRRSSPIPRTPDRS